MVELILPLGVMRTASDDGPRIELKCDRLTRRTTREWFEKASSTLLPWVAVPQAIDDTPTGLSLEYSSSLTWNTTVASLIPEWTSKPGVALPQILGLARFTLTVSEELAREKIDGVSLGPALIHHYPTGPVPWRLIVLPTTGATRNDWAKSDPNIWLWASPSGVSSGRPNDPVHTFGATIHYAITGRLFPDGLSAAGQFSCLLRGEVGVQEMLAAGVLACAPKSCQPDAQALRKLAVECIDTRTGKQPSEADLRARFGEIDRRLGFDRLARSWEADDCTEIADELRRRAAVSPKEPGKPEAPGTPPAGDDWSDVARRESEAGNLAAALSAAWKAVNTEGPQRIELYLMMAQRVAATLPPPRSEIVGTLDRLDHAFSHELIGETNLLRVAHIRMRYLSRPAEEVAPLLRTSKSDWARAAGLLMRAFVQVRTGSGYAETSRLCRESRTIFAKMPHGGGDSGKYGRAFLALLDGITHVGFVASGGPPAYYTDALSQFADALQLAAEVGARNLFIASGRWLSWLAWMASLTPGPDATTIRIATDALLRLHSLPSPGHGLHEMPEIPWYDEQFIFPV